MLQTLDRAGELGGTDLAQAKCHMQRFAALKLQFREQFGGWQLLDAEALQLPLED